MQLVSECLNCTVADLIVACTAVSLVLCRERWFLVRGDG